MTVPQDFVDVPFTTDAASLADDALAALQDAWPDWTPNDADQEVVVMEALAPMAADCAEQASQMPAAALRAYGTQMLGIAYDPGLPASTTVTITTVDNSGYVIPAGSQFNCDGYAFEVVNDADVDAGTTSTSGIDVQCTLPTTEANGLSGDVVAAISMPSFVDTIELDADTANGTDPMDDDTYTNLVSSELRLWTRTLVSAQDYVLLALQQSGIGRAVCQGNSVRAVTVCLAGTDGLPVSSDVKTAYEALCNANRLINNTITVDDPTYSTVNVTYNVLALAGFDTTDLVSRINDMLSDVLSPASYGKPSIGQDPTEWINTPVVYPNWVVAQISGVRGVYYVTSLSLTATGPAPTHTPITPGGDGSITLVGSFPLPEVGTLSGTATAP